MKRKVLLRCMTGFPVGIAVGHIIEILISLVLDNGAFSPCAPGLIRMMGSEINAVVVQTLLCGILGAGFAGSSVIWEMEDWSLMKQTGIHFTVISLILMPIAYLTHWMEHSLKGFLGYFGIFFLIFLVVWVIQFGTGKRSVRKMNAKLHKIKDKNN